MNVLALFEPHPYSEIFDVCEGVRARFTDIGHLLGSASIELWLTKGEETRKVVFSGDIGNTNQPLLRDPLPTAHADYVVMESTYGNRYHERRDSEEKYDSPVPSGSTEDGTGANAPSAGSSRHIEQLAEVIRSTLLRGGNVVIPAFAVGRTQSLLYFIRQIRLRNLIPEFPDFPVYVDSPMAVSATSIFENNELECYDEEASALLAKGINPISFPGLHLSITTDESKAINTDPEPKVIISASGMCDAGRIQYHLKFNLGNPASTILFVGYQSEGTLGRRLLDGVRKVKIHGTEYEVRARIAQMDGMSGHADKAGLLAWIQSFEEKPRQVFIVHGDDEAADSFADCLTKEYGYQAMAPYSGTQYDLLAGRFIRIAKPVPVQAQKQMAVTAEGSQGAVQSRTASAVRSSSGTGREGTTGSGGPRKSAAAADSYTKLKIAGRRLAEVIDGASGLSNKDLAAFTRQINDLCNRYRISD